MKINQFGYKYTIVNNNGCALYIGKSAKEVEQFSQKDIVEKLESYFQTQEEILLNGKFRGFQALLTKIKKAGFKIKTNLWDEDYNPNSIVLAVISK
jgi:hypothetical protein